MIGTTLKVFCKEKKSFCMYSTTRNNSLQEKLCNTQIGTATNNAELSEFTNIYKSVLENYTLLKQICDAFRDLVPFAQFKKREKHP